MSLKNYFNDIKKIKVIIVGDVMVDSYVIGKIERNSPEAPVPIINVNQRKNRIGGAANVALNIKALGGIPYLCSCIGKDNSGKKFLDLMKKNKLSSESIIVNKERKTTIKERIIVDKKHVVRIDDEITEKISVKMQEKLYQIIKKLIKKSDLLILQDYDKGVLTKDFINQIINFSRNKIKISVDPKCQNFHSYRNIDLFKPNFQEACKGFRLNHKKVSIKKLGLVSKNYLQKNGINCIMITMSKNGILIVNKDNVKHYKTISKKILDVSGAGDTVISVASLFFIMSVPIEFLGRFSNLAGRLVCQRSGVKPINKKELYREANKNDLDKYL